MNHGSQTFTVGISLFTNSVFDPGAPQYDLVHQYNRDRLRGGKLFTLVIELIFLTRLKYGAWIAQ